MRGEFKTLHEMVIRLLHVDDNNEYLNLLQFRLPLEDSSFEIDKANSAQSALSMLTKKEYDCVLVDYEMPGINGLEFLKAARSKNINIPFIFLTGQGNEEVAAEAFRLGADDYFTKDNTFAHFPRLVNSIKQNISKYRHMQNQQSAAEKIVKQEQQLRALISSMDEVIFLNDEEGRILEYYIPSSGFEIIEKLGNISEKKIEDIVSREISDVLKKYYKDIKRTGERKEIEHSIDTDGNIQWLLIKILPFLNSTGSFSGFLTVLSDITEKKLSQQQVFESEKRHRFILENTFDYIYRIDLRTGKYDFLSPKAADLMGVPYEVIMSTPYFARMKTHPDDMDIVKKLDANRVKDPEKETLISYRIFSADNKIKYLEQRSKVLLESGERRYIIGVFRDITERVRMEQIAQQTEEVYRNFFNEMTDSLILITNKTGKVINVLGGSIIEERYQIRIANFQDKNILEFPESKFIDEKKDRIESVFNNGESYEDFFTLDLPMGALYFRLKAVPIKDFNGLVERIIVLIRDVTQKLKNNQQPPLYKIKIPL